MISLMYTRWPAGRIAEKFEEKVSINSTIKSTGIWQLKSLKKICSFIVNKVLKEAIWYMLIINPSTYIN